MPSKKKRKFTDEEALEMADVMVALATIYSPLHADDLCDKALHYFPDKCAHFNEEDLFVIISGLAMTGQFIKDKNDIVWMIPEEELKEIFDINVLDEIYKNGEDKEFEDPKQILAYADLFKTEGIKEFDELRAFVKSLKFKRGTTAQEAFQIIISGIFYMYDDKVIIEEIKTRVKEDFDEIALRMLIMNLMFVLPRGFLHGYSLKELGNKVLDSDFFDDFESERLEKPKDYRKYPAYSYRECQVMTKKLKESGIFERLCSDNVIELLVDGQEVFAQLLGYYNKDYDIVIYGDRKRLEYNYHFMLSDPDDYPDVVCRVNYCEVFLNDAQGFMTDDIKASLKKRNYDQMPLIIEMDRLEGPILPDNKGCRMIGAVLKQLLEINEEFGDELKDMCQEGNSYLILQFYLDDEGIATGSYSYLELGDPVIPFELDKATPRKIKARRRIELGIGIYTLPLGAEKELSYLTILYDAGNDLIVNFNICFESEMTGIKDRVIDQLEEMGVRPKEIFFNNDFAYDVFDELFDIYKIEPDFVTDPEKLNEIYEDLMDHADLFSKEILVS